MASPQTLSLGERRLVAAWAADCAERVLPIFEAQAPEDGRPRAAIERTRAFACGEANVAAEIRRRFEGGGAAREAGSRAAHAAAKAAGQAAAVVHMGAHALGAAAYAARAAGLAATGETEATGREMRWQLDRLTEQQRAALARLPAAGGVDRAGPLGPGLLARGELGQIVAELQSAIGTADDGARTR